mmetsp:Transcript_39235/g.62088  ORF Transcript_39235/g.62088 Transcript_39235/m.62088 type:complete len:441 (+) Transcript_39235:1907-3229(+)
MPSICNRCSKPTRCPWWWWWSSWWASRWGWWARRPSTRGRGRRRGSTFSQTDLEGTAAGAVDNKVGGSFSLKEVRDKGSGTGHGNIVVSRGGEVVGFVKDGEFISIINRHNGDLGVLLDKREVAHVIIAEGIDSRIEGQDFALVVGGQGVGGNGAVRAISGGIGLTVLTIHDGDGFNGNGDILGGLDRVKVVRVTASGSNGKLGLRGQERDLKVIVILGGDTVQQQTNVSEIVLRMHTIRVQINNLHNHLQLTQLLAIIGAGQTSKDQGRQFSGDKVDISFGNRESVDTFALKSKLSHVFALRAGDSQTGGTVSLSQLTVHVELSLGVPGERFGEDRTSISGAIFVGNVDGDIRNQQTTFGFGEDPGRILDDVGIEEDMFSDNTTEGASEAEDPGARLGSFALVGDLAGVAAGSRVLLNKDRVGRELRVHLDGVVTRLSE